MLRHVHVFNTISMYSDCMIWILECHWKSTGSHFFTAVKALQCTSMHFNALQVPRCTDGLMAEVLNQLTAAYESWRDEDGLRTVSLRSLNHVWETQTISRWINLSAHISPWAFAQVLRYLLGWPSTVLQHVLEARRNDRNTVCNDVLRRSSFGLCCQAPPPERLCFQNLRDFLDGMRSALSRLSFMIIMISPVQSLPPLFSKFLQYGASRQPHSDPFRSFERSSWGMRWKKRNLKSQMSQAQWFSSLDRTARDTAQPEFCLKRVPVREMLF